MKISTAKILPNPDQPRKSFDPGELETLASSIKTDGLLSPISVEGPHNGDIYILIDGERRLRAVRLLGWSSIEAYVRRPARDGNGRLLLAMIGNLQRSDMGPVDEAAGYRKLRDSGMDTEEIAARVGRTIAHVYSRMRMLELPEVVQGLFNARRLPVDEVSISALRRLQPEQMTAVAQVAANRQYSARQIQSAAARIAKGNGKAVTPIKAPRVVHSESTCPALDFNPGLSKSWSWVRGAAKKTCEVCGLYEGGGKNTICKECPLTLFIGRIAAGYKADEGESHE